MFSRRKSRTGHNTAYTGVNHYTNNQNQPNSNALAAAHTIGNGLAKPTPQTTGSRTNSTISRSPSVQFQPQMRSNSVLKRSLSISVRSSAPPGQFSGFGSPGPALGPLGLSPGPLGLGPLGPGPQGPGPLDPNRRSMADLKLSSEAPKMVKKYIPTPNGIKVIEVPQSNMDKEIARNNSMRSGTNIPRSPSMGSMKRRLSLQKPGLRQSSLLKVSPKLPQMNEDTVAETEENDQRLRELQAKIDREKEIQRKIELKQLEYEELRAKRVVEEREEDEFSKAKESKEESNHANDYSNDYSNNSNNSFNYNNSNNGLGIKESTPGSEDDPSKYVEKPNLADINTVDADDSRLLTPGSSIHSEESSDPSDPGIDASNVVVDELETLHIDPSMIKVDEKEMGRKEKDEENNEKDERNNENNEKNDKDDITINGDDDFGIEEGEFDADDTPNLKSGPTFDVTPDIINGGEGDLDKGFDNDNYNDNNNNNLKAPEPFYTTSSMESDPESPLKPRKSAMKNSSSFYSPKNGTSQPSTAARDAYVSLTTAENTKLNSKVSASQLNDSQYGSHQYPSSTSINKRMSQTLRKPPSQSNGLANKTLRPHSMQPESRGFIDPNSQPGNRMSGRQLRDRGSMNIPIQNQNQSKNKAAELYAKANSRPYSTFTPRRSSFSKEDDGGGVEGGRPQERPHRTTLRDMIQETERSQGQERSQNGQQSQSQQSQGQIQNQQIQNQQIQQSQSHLQPHHTLDPNLQKPPHTPTKPSRFNDSDDEIFSPDSAFSSRVNDTIESKPQQPQQPQQPPPQYQQPPSNQPEMLTLRDIKQPKQKEGKEKKKFSKLRKLFGKNVGR